MQQRRQQQSRRSLPPPPPRRLPPAAAIKGVESFDGAFTLDTVQQEVLEELLRSELFCQQVRRLTAMLLCRAAQGRRQLCRRWPPRRRHSAPPLAPLARWPATRVRR